MKKQYKVTNIGEIDAQFRDQFLGVDRIVQPGESVLTYTPPEDARFSVEENEEKPQKKTTRRND